MTDCLTLDCLRQAVIQGKFSGSDALGALHHFLSPCRSCWHQVDAVALNDSVDIDLEALSRRY